MSFLFNVENHCDDKKVKFSARKVSLCRLFVTNHDGCTLQYSCIIYFFLYTFTYTILNQYIKQFSSLLMMTVPSVFNINNSSLK